jgi:Ca2+-binding EF-hand superfamily protein
MDLMLAMTHEGDTSCGLGHHEVTRLFDEIDTNHNGFIDKKELLGLVKRYSTCTLLPAAMQC